MEDKVYRRFREFQATEDQSEQPVKSPKVQQYNQGQQQSTSTVTSTSTRLGVSAPEALQSMEQQMQHIREMHQEDMEVDIPNSHEVQQTLRDTQMFMGTPKMGKREERQSEWDTCYMELISQLVDSEPSSFEEVVQYQVSWDVVEEYTSIMQNDMWEFVLRLTNKVMVGSGWIYKIKHNANGNIKKYKSIFVAKGFSQKKGIDNEVNFSPMARYTSMQFMMSLTAQMGWQIHQMNVKTMFLNGELEEEMYIEKLEGFVTHNRETQVCRLKRDWYRLKQAPKVW